MRKDKGKNKARGKIKIENKKEKGERNVDFRITKEKREWGMRIEKGIEKKKKKSEKSGNRIRQRKQKGRNFTTANFFTLTYNFFASASW